jgi:hypothetical protein
MDNRRLSIEDERQRRAEKMQNAGLLLQAGKEGYVFDPESGLMSETDAGRENRLAEIMVKKAHARYYDAAGAASGMKGSKNQEFQQLPMEDQEVVKDLSKKNASKIAIANQIESVMSGWDRLPDDQKVMQGRQLIKVLNSTEGADAVGAEEAKRLGGKLEFAMGNLFNSNPIQFGRDLPGFKDQASGTAKAIRGAVSANEGEVDARYRKAGIRSGPSNRVPLDSASSNAHPMDSEAVAWAKANRRDPRAAEILRINGVE